MAKPDGTFDSKIADSRPAVHIEYFQAHHLWHREEK